MAKVLKKHPAVDMRDGGFASRKLWYAIGTSTGVFVTGCLAAFWPSFRPSLEAVIGGLLGTLVAYLGGNVTNKFVVGKNLSKASVTEDEEESDEEVEPVAKKVKSKPPIEQLPPE